MGSSWRLGRKERLHAKGERLAAAFVESNRRIQSAKRQAHGWQSATLRGRRRSAYDRRTYDGHRDVDEEEA